MQIAGFDVLLVGRKGFSSLARARKLLIRAKGAPKDSPWTTIDVSKYKKKAEKQKVLTKILIKLTTKRDAEAAAKEKKKREKLKPPKIPKAKKEKKKLEIPEELVPEKPGRKPKAKKEKKEKKPKAPPLPKIKFKLDDTAEKAIKTRSGRFLDIKKFYFHADTPLDFVYGRKFVMLQDKGKEIPALEVFLQAAKEKFIQDVYKKYGKREYLFRFFHDYSGLPDQASVQKPDAGFGGLSINRAPYTRKDVNEQFDEIIPEQYLEQYSTYLRKGSDQTYFRFTGFSVEVTVKELEDDGQVQRK